MLMRAVIGRVSRWIKKREKRPYLDPKLFKNFDELGHVRAAIDRKMKLVIRQESRGIDENANIVRDPTFPDIPHFLEAYEIVHGKPPEPGPALDAYIAFFSAGFPAQKMALLHKTTPAEVVDAYRTAFAKAVADPELQARKADILGEYQQATGDAAERLFGIATTIDEGAKTWVQDYLRKNYNVNL